MPQPFLLPLLITLALLNGCGSLGYYYQATKGQMEIWQRSQPIGQVLSEEPADSELARRLRLVLEVRRFALTELALPDTGSYQDYADLRRPYVVWNLFAAPELSLTPREWCYPLIGCLSYRGYFNPDDALKSARTLEQEGWDTYVGGIIAYSTLGWFDDPVLNTFWRLDDTSLAALLFHEMAHPVAFARGDTTFNESFATAVELHGIRLWLAQQQNEHHFLSVQTRFERRQQVLGLIQTTVDQLKQLYDSDYPDPVKRAGKQQLFEALTSCYKQLRELWEEDPGFDAWFQTPLSNAKLMTLTSYYDLVPAFQEKIRQLDGDLPAFYRWVRTMADTSKPERDAILAQLVPTLLSGTEQSGPVCQP